MKDFENIGKRMPYTEDKDYISKLVERTTESALRQQPKAKTFSLKAKWMAVAATAAILLAGAGITFHHSTETQQPMLAQETAGPIDIFLNNLSDEDVQQLAYFELEEIPEEAFQ